MLMKVPKILDIPEIFLNLIEISLLITYFENTLKYLIFGILK